jgi:simple sugar transport system permease protein
MKIPIKILFFKAEYLELRFQKRTNFVTGLNSFALRVLFLFFGFVAVGIIFLVNGVNPIELFVASERSMLRVILILMPNTFARFIPLLCIAVGLAIPFKARVDNIGAEGQFVMGMLAATWLAFEFPELPSIILIPLMLILGFIIGAIWALPVVFFRARGGFQGADVVVSFLMVFPALYLMEYLVSGPWRDPETGFTYSEQLPPSAQIPTLDFIEIYVPFLDTTWDFSPVHFTIFLVLLISVILYYFLFRTVDGIPKTKIGYEISVTGKNPQAGRLAGMSFFKVILISMIISGGLAGLAGVGEIAGNQLRLTTNSPGYGFTAIVVAYLGGLNPLGIIFSALFFAAILAGGVAINLTGLPVTALDMFAGIILFFVLLSEFFFRYTLKWRVIR